jgi:hypothetical protein
VHRGLVRVHFKLGSTLPDWHPGDLVVLVVTVNEDGSFTLVDGRTDGTKGQDPKGDGDQKPATPTGDTIGATGTLTGRDDGKVSVTTDRGVVSCKVPTTMNISVFAIGDKVTIYCKKRDDVFWLVGMKSDKATVTDPGTTTPTPTPPPAPVSTAGVLTDGPAGSVTIKLENGTTVSCKLDKQVPAGLFRAGDKVKVTCLNGTLTGLRSDISSWNPTTNELGIGGLLTAGSGGTATVKHDDVSVSCSLAASLDLTTLVPLGTKVWMSCKVRDGANVFALVSVGDQLTLKADGTGERYAAGRSPAVRTRSR